MKREELFGLLGQIKQFPVMQILVVTATTQFTAERPGKLVKATKKGAILLTPRGATLVQSLRVGKSWFPVWRGEVELSEEELTKNEGELIAAINAMK